MADPYRKVSPGEQVNFSAPAWNAFVDAAKAEQQKKLDAIGGQATTFRDACIIRVKNGSDRDLSRFNVLGLGSPIFTPEDSLDSFLQEVTFRAGLPDLPDHFGRFVVLLEPVRAGGIARAYLSGVCPVLIDRPNPSVRWARAEQDETGWLVADPAGTAEILWPYGDESFGYDVGYGGDPYDGYGYNEGIEWCIVRVGNEAPGFYPGQSTTIIAANGTGSASLTDPATGDSLGVHTVHNHFTRAIPSGRKVGVVPGGGMLWVVGADC